ncbi:hypothetical protein IC582_029825 [Cucumis melo]|uniref:CDT1-like protein a, chloroplastic isoform X1 n=2 Tax=Cucumis melo TaxID=3656 RepID=A0A1S3ATS0_CUCME|nr:CDT1-like protein a, chloroplastic isoform X1 [Cucumis melo]
MGEKTFDDGGLNVSAIETNPSMDKQIEGIHGNQNSESNIACMTPEKADEYLKGKLKEEEIKLQEKCQTIVEFFTCLTSSMRLLKMRKKMSTFHNVSRQVSVMTKRMFLDKHLAQIVYIIPEAVNIDKVMIHDKKTSCMKPEMIISLQLDVVKGHSEHSDFLALHKVFASRVLKYFAVHTEKNEVPEGALPKPFNRRKIFSLDQLSDNSPERSRPTSIDSDLTLEELCPHSSLKRHFSKKSISSVEISEPVASSIVFSPSIPACSSLKEEDTNDKLLEDIPTLSPQVAAANSSESPLVKSVLSSASSSIMTQTPVQLTPKRSMLPSSEVKTRKPASVGSVCKPAKRFLNFSGMEGDNGKSSLGVDDLQIPGKKNFLDEHFEKKNYTSKEVISQESSSCLPELVCVVYNIFKSVNCSSITKEELVHKIIMNCLDITERREVEERIEQLEKLVPNWISKKLTISGDVTFSINTKEDLESVVAKTARI